MDQRKITGRGGEDAAAAFLASRGVRILERNYRTRFGEIDLIGQDKDYLIAVEVKTRKSFASGLPAEAVDWRKIRKICLTFTRYRMYHHISDFTPVRFDVVEVDSWENCRWIRNAFEYIE